METMDSISVDGVKLTCYRQSSSIASVSEGSNSEVKATACVNGLDINMVTVTDGEKETCRQTEVEDGQCGCGSCHPECLQGCAKPVTYLICISAIVLVQSMLVSGYTGSIITTIEKRYNLWSRDTGFVMSSYDIMSMVAVIVISYYGDQHNRAKWIGRGIIVMSLGAVLFALPHFVGGRYTVDAAYNETEMDVNLCNSTKNRNIQQKMSECSNSEHTPQSWMLAIFVIAQMIIGLGAAPVYTLGPTYLYDNVRPQLYSMYAGVMYSMSALGPAIGFLMGAGFLQIFVNPWQAPSDLTDADPSWVGAWWMGFLLCGVLAFFSGLPLLLFPRELPSVEKVDSGDKPVMMTFVTSLKELPNQTKKLFSNFTWLFISLCIICELSITTGFVVFIAKYFQVSFDLSASVANIITGAVIIPGACTGILTGSLLMRWLNSKLALAGIVKFLIILSIFPALAVITLLFLGCKKIDLAGITSNYYSGTENSLEIIEVKYQKTLKASCNANCACSQSNYMPVCGFDQKTYYSPCHAGCTELDIYKDLSGLMVRNYSSCQCIYQDFVHSGDTAFPGKCDNSCYNLIPFLVILFFIIFLTACGQNASLIITLRSVDPKRRSFALGIQNFLSRILALIPAPMFFGRIFDSQCLLRSPGCERDGACLEYDTRRLPFVLFGTCLGIKLLSIVFLSLTYMSCRHSHDNKVPSGDNTSSNPDNTASDASTLNSTSTMTVSTVCSQL